MQDERKYLRIKGGPLTSNPEYNKYYRKMVRKARAVSDSFYKERIYMFVTDENIDDVGLIADILSLNGYSFSFKDVGTKDERIVFKKEEHYYELND